MFKAFKPTFLVVPVAWLAVLLSQLIDLLGPALKGYGVTPRAGWVVLGVQILVTLIFATPVWRFVWKKIPSLGKVLYPDFNGDWDVELLSNWSRVDALVRAANHETHRINVRAGPAQLPELMRVALKARITQKWLSMKIELWDPSGVGPIKESKTISVQPIRGIDGRHGLTYVFEQESNTDVISDDPRFRGAAWLVQDRDDANVLCGRMCNDRMWRRGMNTAGDLFFRRCAE